MLGLGEATGRGLFPDVGLLARAIGVIECIFPHQVFIVAVLFFGLKAYGSGFVSDMAHLR